MKGIIIKDALIIPLSSLPGGTAWFRGDIIIEGSYIKAIGEKLLEKENQPDGAAFRDYSVIDGQDCLVIPGFVNCHTHAAMTMLRGYADDLPLQPWLRNKNLAAEAHLQADDIYWGRNWPS